jgi:hypothetical protein
MIDHTTELVVYLVASMIYIELGLFEVVDRNFPRTLELHHMT